MSSADGSQETRADRIARYKEERRKQLASQFGGIRPEESKRPNRDSNSSSGSDGPRTTRASRLRAAALATTATQSENVSTRHHQSGQNVISTEKVAMGFGEVRNKLVENRRDKDKSSKRKSNLNRSLNSEEIQDNLRSHRRGLNILSSDNQNNTLATHSSELHSLTATTTHAPITASSTSTTSDVKKTSVKKSQLSIHMENARKSVGSAQHNETVKTKLSTVKSPISSMVTRERLKKSNLVSAEDRDCQKISDKENRAEKGMSEEVKTDKLTAKRMDELTALTRETLARVERLASKNRASPCRELKKSSPSPTNSLSKYKNSPSSATAALPSFEKSPAPVSILKRKVLQDDPRQESSTHTPPVTFSPSVVEPTSSSGRRQGILKKRRSLDESQVMRHRSCSPDVANQVADSKSILKNQRRSSLEELRRVESPETHLQGILKRKSSKPDVSDTDASLNSPQGILKRRSGASSAGSTGSSPHVSITTAVILAAARGAEMILDDDDDDEAVRPILKKKSWSEEHYATSESFYDAPKPILKKKSSTDTDTDYYDEKPKKPILKLSRSSLDRDFDSAERSRSGSIDTEYGEAMKPILKQTTKDSKDTKDDSISSSSKPKLSFCEEDLSFSGDVMVVRRQQKTRRSFTVGGVSDLNILTSEERRSEWNGNGERKRPVSVCELITSFECPAGSTGAIPKRTSLSRNSDRYKTQPVTSEELEASLHYVNSPSIEDLPKNYLSSPVFTHKDNYSARSLLDVSSFDRESSFMSSQLRSASPDSSGCAKMSSDSAFQSLGDGLELEQDDEKCSSKPSAVGSLEAQMKAIAEEAKKIKLDRGNAALEKYRTRKSLDLPERSGIVSRFSTQPVTFEEVQEATRIKKNDGSGEQDYEPSRLSLSDRIKMFSSRNAAETNDTQKRVSLGRAARFKTQPVTLDEVWTARGISPTNLALDEEENNSRKGILKPPSESFSRKRLSSPDYTSSTATKTSDTTRVLPNASFKHEIPDITYDEGISCNDSGSDSENASAVVYSDKKQTKSGKSGLYRSASARYSEGSRSTKWRSDETSDGDSSGGREVSAIFKGDKTKIKQSLENIFAKGKSQALFDDDDRASFGQRNSNIRRSFTQGAMPKTIAELQATLQRKGESDWRKRIVPNVGADDELKLLKEKNKYNEELSEKTLLASRKNDLDAAAKQWKSRVEKSDAEKFSVVGRMAKSKDGQELQPIAINIPASDTSKKIPQAKRFKGRDSDCFSTPVSPEKNDFSDLKRSKSVPDPKNKVTILEPEGGKTEKRNVTVARPDDDTFKNFYRSVEENRVEGAHLDLTLDDLDAITRHSLLVQKKNVQVQKRRGASRNPIKALATRSDIRNEYTEVIIGVAERETKRLNIEKLAKSSSNFAIEALAGLASKEDFKSVPLKKSTGLTKLLPYKDLMLLHVKGRRHIQTRLVAPVAESINEGDNYILITPTELYNYIGAFSNVIEQTRASDVSNQIQQRNDLGCKATKVVTVTSKMISEGTRDARKFWRLLGGTSIDKSLADAGNPSEDEIYESNILSTNMIYGLDNDELVPLDKYWGNIPKIDMLTSTNVLVFDFGSEMYVWSGKTAAVEEKQRVLTLAKELWNEGFNYSDCNVCPLNVASILGDRPEEKLPFKGEKRPDWALFAKLTQHRETILFKEKFLDWPDPSRVIRVKGTEVKNVDPTYDIKPCPVDDMLKGRNVVSDLVIPGNHLGRGDQYFDEETKRLFEFDTLELTVWRILENTYEKLESACVGHFYDAESYIVRWKFRVTVKGRELGGKPSKYVQSGKDRFVYFIWQGTHATANEKGTAALLTVELDSENAPQIRVAQGAEPAAFLRLFDGAMVVRSGKREKTCDGPTLFICRADVDRETFLFEVPRSAEQLRSRTSFVMADSERNTIAIWHGSKSSRRIRKNVKRIVEKIVENSGAEFGLDSNVKVREIEEGDKDRDFDRVLSPNVGSYVSLATSDASFDYTLRMFYFSSISGSFEATEILSTHRSEFTSAFPFLQSELYAASQPALFLVDNDHELWLWQGWWPDREEDETDLSDQTGSGAVRWQAERRAAIQTCIDYWNKKHEKKKINGSMVWAGLEPVEFKNLFPHWCDRDDVTELNMKEGKRMNEKRDLEKELALLSRTTYPLAELLQRPLPDGVDPTHLEIYLSPEDFKSLLSMSKEEFRKLPSWKQTSLKKKKGLF